MRNSCEGYIFHYCECRSPCKRSERRIHVSLEIQTVTGSVNERAASNPDGWLLDESHFESIIEPQSPSAKMTIFLREILSNRPRGFSMTSTPNYLSSLISTNFFPRFGFLHRSRRCNILLSLFPPLLIFLFRASIMYRREKKSIWILFVICKKRLRSEIRMFVDLYL